MEEARPRLRPLIAALLIPAAVLVAAAAVGIRSRLTATSAAAPEPPARVMPAMAYDEARGEVVMFGGRDKAGLLDDTWLWDGSSWRQAHPATSPPSRYGAAIAYDPGSRRVVMYGGSEAHDGATWTWDGSTWTAVQTAHHPAGLPGSPVAMALDVARGQLVMVATDVMPSRVPVPVAPASPLPGQVSDVMPMPAIQVSLAVSTWIWKGGDWVEQAGPMPDRPPGTLGLAWDGSTRRLVLLGDTQSVTCIINSGGSSAGWSGYSPLPGNSCRSMAVARPHWLWDGHGWSLGPASAQDPRPKLPEPLLGRTGYGMASDPQHHVVLLFGGGIGQNYLSDTWMWDGKSWSRVQA